jgi:hypothetical protein
VRPLAPTNSLPGGRAAPEVSSVDTLIESGDLFAGKPVLKRSPAAKRRLAPELTAARVLCNQLRRKRALPEKKRIVHLICLNLLAILNRPSQQA